MSSRSEALTAGRTPLRRIPSRRYLIRLWGRALTLYAVLRLVTAQGSVGIDRMLGDVAPSRWAMDWRAMLILFAVVGGLVWVFARRRRELALLRSLGVDTRVLLAVAIAPAIGLEILVQWWLV